MALDLPAKEKNIHFENVWDINPADLQSFSTQVTVVDVRLKEEVAIDTLPVPGAVSIPLVDLVDRISEIPKNRPVVVTCRNGWRSARAAAYLAQKGFSEVYNLKGGLLLWNEFLATQPLNQLTSGEI